MSRLAIVAGAFLVMADAAAAAVLTRCGGSEGLAFYLPGPAVPQGEAGWSDERIGDGNIMLVSNGDEVDIIFTDVIGTRSVKASGAETLAMHGAPGRVLVLAIYPNAAIVEHYIFTLDQTGAGNVLWGSAKAGGPIQKSGIMYATCWPP